MDTGSTGWWRRHGWTIAILLVAFSIAFVLRTAWAYPIIARWGPLYTYAGGSDSYYHSRVMAYIIQTGHNLVYDPMLKFPIGATNPREPLFDWMNAVLGIVFSPFFGGNAVVAGAWFLNLQPPLWAALQVFPIYLIGREVSGRRSGLIATLIYPFLAASINSSTFGYANYLSFYTFVLLVVVYAYLRTVKTLGHTRYIESYRNVRQYWPGLRAFFRQEPLAVKWSVFAGVALGALALAWQGYTYAVVVISIGLLVSMVIERIRRVDSFGLYVSTWIIGLVGFGMASPYYIAQHEVKVFLDVPLLLFFGVVLLLLPFLLMRDVPWVFSIPALVGIVVAGVVGLRFVSPTFFTNIVTGQGYFVKTLVYTTVAEAQAPSIDQLVVGYGVVTFFLAFVGLALAGYLLVHHRFRRHHVGFLVYALVSLYLPVSATKFFLVGAPIFALLSAEALHRALDVGGYPQLRRTVASLSDRGGQWGAFRKSFKARHVLVLLLVVGLLLPNIWVAIDGGIPGNSKDAFARQVNSTIPTWLKLNHTAPATNYFGQAGSSLDTPNQYDSAAYNWLAQQDTNIPEPSRPAFISWWDYGFQAIDQGQHPSVADNFQNGIDPAGQFLLAQNESLAIGVLATTLLQGEILKSGEPTLPASLNTILVGDGVNVTTLHQLLDDGAADYKLVVNNPGKYLPVNPDTITDDNAMYLAVSYYLADHLTLSGVARVYDDLQGYTGWSIRYDMVDSRLFPFSGQNTGIFYAPADLTGRVINAAGVPSTYYNVTIQGSDGNTYPLGRLPAGVTAVNYNINWSTPFYRTMLYRTYIGYNGTDIGLSGGIPGLSGAAAPSPIEPGWMLQHFEVVYKTAYVCPGVKGAFPGAACFHPTNVPDAVATANRTHGTADTNSSAYFSGGETMLAYYPGQTLYGTITLPGGAPVPGVRVTVSDGWGIPHMSAVTASDGTFSLVLPPGNDTLNISSGAFDAATQGGSNFLNRVHLNVSNAIGFSPSAPPLRETFQLAPGSVNGLVYYNLANNSSYVPQADPVVYGAKVVLTGLGGAPVFTALSDPSGSFHLSEVPPQVYNVTVSYAGQTYNATSENVSSGAATNVSVGLASGFLSAHVQTPSGSPVPGANVVVRNNSGFVINGTTDRAGAADIRQLVPGDYVATAFVPGSSYRSSSVPFSITTQGGAASVNLTVGLRGTISVEVNYAGAAAGGISVRFVPEIGLANGSLTPIASLEGSLSATTFATTDAQGFASAAVAPGPYSIYAFGTENGQRVAAIGSIVSVAGASLGPFPLVLTLAQPVAVSVTGPFVPSNASRTAVVAYPSGSQGEVVGWASSNTTAVLYLPNGSYSFAALFGTTTIGSGTLAGLASANVSGLSNRFTIPLTTAAATHFLVGASTSSGGISGAYLAQVAISAGPTGPFVRMLSGPNGTTGLALPDVAPGSTDGYCVHVQAFGYATNSSCGWTTRSLQNLSFYYLELVPVSVTLSVHGLPPSTPVTVTLTAESPTAVNRTLVGGPSFSLSLPPGTYGVGAKAVIGNGTTVYLPSTILATTLALGTTYSNLSLTVVPEINASGPITLPSGANYNTTEINLTSPILNVSVNATNYTKGFRATPGNYTAAVSTTVAGVRYVNVSRVNVAANGSISPRLVVSQKGVSATGLLLQSNHQAVRANTSATLVTSSGIVLPLAIANGSFTAELPPGTYGVFVNATTQVRGTNGTYFESWVSTPGMSCTYAANLSRCEIPMNGTVERVNASGTLVRAGLPTFLDGTVRLVGPYPSTNVTVVNATLGSFAASLLPGAYFVFAQSSSSANLAGFARLLAFPGSATVAVPLAPTWAVTVNVVPANGTVLPNGTANVQLKDAFGNITVFAGAPVNSSFVVDLPVGSYRLNASAPGTLSGFPGTATAAAALSVANGNVAVTLPLSVPLAARVNGVVVGSSTATVAAGGSVTFPFTLSNTGNVPVTVHAVGAPSGWSFAYSFTNATLAPHGASLAAEVRITVPNGTAVTHPPIVIAFDAVDGSQVGALSPALTVNVLPYYGVKLYANATGARVGETSAKVGFNLKSTGNAFEQVRLSVVDAARLASIGWTATLVAGNSVLKNGLVNLSAGGNDSLLVNLTANATVFEPPLSVTVEAQVLNVSGSVVTSITVPVPRAVVTPSPSKTYVTGPSVAGGPSGVPDWLVPLLVFVPAIGLAVGLLVRRWLKTRRWTRR